MTHHAAFALRRYAPALPPLLVLALLIGLPRLLSHERRSERDDAEQLASLRSAFEASPLYIGDWIGEEVAVPTAAIEMLRPTAVLSRRFRNVRTGQAVNLLVVHCSDARDMGSHYPPVCYPSQGWLRQQFDDATTCEVDLGSAAVPLRNYNFVRGTGADMRRLRVLNCFIQLNGAITPDRPRINYMLERSDRSAVGVAQLQVVDSGGASVADTLRAATEIIRGHAALLRILQHQGTSS